MKILSGSADEVGAVDSGRAVGSRSQVVAWAVALLTICGFAIRLAGIRQSLLGDELLLYWEVWQRSAREVIAQVGNPVELNPPLFFLLARASQKLGDPSVMVRLPSLLAGTATIPLAWRLGLRIASARAALVAAAVVTFSSFAVYYSNEARPYGLLAFLAPLSTLLLLRAIDAPSVGRWIAYSLGSAAVLYTHYTGLFVLLAQFVWAAWAHRETLKGLLISNAGAAVLFLPWLPTALQPSFIFQSYGPFAVDGHIPTVLQKLLVGSPLSGVGVDRVPGFAALTLIVAALVAAGVIGIAERLMSGSRGRTGPAAMREPRLLPALALATPVGMILASAVKSADFFLPRNLSASFVALSLVVAVILTLPRGWPGWVTAGLAVAGMSWGAVLSLDSSVQRPDARAAARWIDAQARPEPLVYDATAVWDGLWPLSPYLRGVDDAEKRKLQGYVNNLAMVPRKSLSAYLARAAVTGRDVAAVVDSTALDGGPVVVPPEFRDRFVVERQARFPGFQGGLTVILIRNLMPGRSG